MIQYRTLGIFTEDDAITIYRKLSLYEEVHRFLKRWSVTFPDADFYKTIYDYAYVKFFKTAPYVQCMEEDNQLVGFSGLSKGVLKREFKKFFSSIINFKIEQNHLNLIVGDFYNVFCHMIYQVYIYFYDRIH